MQITLSLKSSSFLRQLRDNILTSVKNILVCVNLDFVKSIISNVSFRIYCTEEMRINAASTMAAARTERSLPEQQFLIPRPKENSWGHRWVLDKENIIHAFVGTTPVMNKPKDAECITEFLDAKVVNRVQDLGITPFANFLPRSAPLVDFLAVGLHSGAGWKFSFPNTILGIQQN